MPKRLISSFGILASILSVGICQLSDEETRFAFEQCMVNNQAEVCRMLIENDIFVENIDECDDESCGITGILYAGAGYKNQAIQYLKKAIDLGQVNIYGVLADVYMKLMDYVNAKKNYERCIELCSDKMAKAASLTFLAAIYEAGGNVAKKDLQKAIELYKNACDLDSPLACYQLGLFYIEGVGVSPNLHSAKKYYGKSCDLGQELACIGYQNLIKQGVQ